MQEATACASVLAMDSQHPGHGTTLSKRYAAPSSHSTDAEQFAPSHYCGSSVHAESLQSEVAPQRRFGEARRQCSELLLQQLDDLGRLLTTPVQAVSLFCHVRHARCSELLSVTGIPRAFTRGQRARLPIRVTRSMVVNTYIAA